MRGGCGVKKRIEILATIFIMAIAVTIFVSIVAFLVFAICHLIAPLFFVAPHVAFKMMQQIATVAFIVSYLFFLIAYIAGAK